MENIFWKWTNLSTLIPPTRYIKWELRMPYIFSVSGSLFDGFSFGFWFLFFHAYYITDVSCGRLVKFTMRKWCIGVIVRNGWAFYLDVGLPINAYRLWKRRRLLKNMTLDELYEFLDDLSKEDCK